MKGSLRYLVIIIIGGAFAFVSWAAFMPPFGFLAHTFMGIDAASGTAFSAGFGVTADTAAMGASSDVATDTSAALDFAAALPLANALIYFIMLGSLFALAWIDHDTMEIPDRFHIIIAACGMIALFIGPAAGVKSHLIGIGVASLPLFIIMIVCLLATGAEAFGFGDVKLMAAAGFFLGWQHALVALFLGIIIGGAYGGHLLATHKKTGRDHFAFGPALCVGIGIAMFAAEPIINWYLRVL